MYVKATACGQVEGPVCGELLILGKSVIRHTHVRQIELCHRHAKVVIAREQALGFEIFDRRDWR